MVNGNGNGNGNERARSPVNPLTRPQAQNLKQDLRLAGVVNARTIKGLALNAGPNVLEHGLSAAPQGWLVARLRNAPAVVYETGTADAVRLTLVATAGCVVDLLVW